MEKTTAQQRQIKKAFSFRKNSTTYQFLLAYAQRVTDGNTSAALSKIIEAYRETPAGRMIDRQLAKEAPAQRE